MAVNNTAMDNVFGIVELAEKIFLECRIQEVLLNQRVCKHWRNITVRSKRLQQALFFEPLPGYKVQYYHSDERGNDTAFPPYFADYAQNDKNQAGERYKVVGWDKDLVDELEEALTEDELRRWNECERTLVFANPLLDKLNRKQFTRYHAPPSYAEAAREEYKRREQIMRNPDASWRRMLASQPPLECVSFTPFQGRYYAMSPDEVIDENRDSEGIRIADAIVSYGGPRVTYDCPEVEAMTPVIFAKDVIRVNYWKGDLEFERVDFDWGFGS